MTSRNAPCPCGSGRKYKNCHGKGRPSGGGGNDAQWRTIRRALDGFPSTMFGFVHETFGAAAVDEAWSEFMLWRDGESRFDPASTLLPLFMPWFFHAWMPDEGETSVGDPDLHGRSPTAVYLKRKGWRLKPVLRSYLEGCLEAPFTFFDVLNVDPGRGFRVRDVLTGHEHDVSERSASDTLEAGSLLFGQVVVVGEVALLEASSPYALPPVDKLEVIDLRERIRPRAGPVTADVLRDWEQEIRHLYLRLLDQMLNPAPRQMQNTDGDMLLFHELFYEIDAPGVAFDALKDLAHDRTSEELLEDAGFDDAGALRRVAFSWTVPGNPVMAEWDNTVHGNLEIDGRELRADVNSKERAERLKGMIAERLGAAARLVRTEVRTLEESLAAARLDDDPGPKSDPLDSPEVEVHMRELVSANHEGWASRQVPALGGLTPLEAVESPAGREKVEVLVREMEEHARRMRPPVDEAAIRRLRERLGLD